MQRTDEEIVRAIVLFTLSRDGLKSMKLDMHVMVVDASIEALKWVKGEPSKFGDSLAVIESELRSGLAVNN